MPNQQPVWLAYAALIVSAIAAIVALGVGLMQFYLQRQQFKQTLYQQRYAVYDAVKQYLIYVVQKDGDTDFERYGQFRRESEAAAFLFGSDIWTYLTHISKRALEWRTAKRELDRIDRVLDVQNPPAVSVSISRALDDHSLWLERHSTASEEILAQLETGLNQVFRPYLQLHQDGTAFQRFKTRLNHGVESGETVLNTRYERQ
jgi:hypothetical protein